MIWTCVVVFAANAALLVLQLVVGRLLAPFIGISLATWTAVIGVILTGISLGNWLGGKLADRAASERTLRWLLLGGAACTALTLGLVYILGDGSALRSLPLTPRIAVLTLATCLPPSLVLSLITPVAIKLLLPDVAHTGRVAGLIYAVGTLGSLVGNFLTGFVLLAHLTTHAIVLGTAGLLAVLGVLVRTGSSLPSPGFAGEGPGVRAKPALGQEPSPPAPLPQSRERGESGTPVLSLRAACAIVFLASFGSMALEIAASRLLAPQLGVSLYSWTGIIGVVLTAVMLGNFVGGRIADQSPTPETLGNCLFFAGMFTLITLPLAGLLSRSEPIGNLDLITRVLVWATALFFVPMFLIGTVSPQITRLAVADWEHAGRVAGRVYAWSCAGAIAGTFAAGWGLIPLLGGVHGVVLAVSLVLILLAAVLDKPWKRPAELFVGSIVVGAALFGLAFKGLLTSRYVLETNYYAISVEDAVYQNESVKALHLDRLIHSYVKPDDPTFMGYAHEQVQAEFARLASARTSGQPNLLVIGGGGYTYPRWLEHTLPGASVEVVEIDPGVTEVAHRELGLSRQTRIVSHHMDGRQFVQEQAPKGHYQLIAQDAVNDLSVPYHIMTKEYNDAVARLLAADGVYLLTVIDEYEDGLLMRAAVRTMQQTFPHVHLLGAGELWEPTRDDDGTPQKVGRQVWVIYGSAKPFERNALAAALQHQNAGDVQTLAMPDEKLKTYLDAKPAPILTDAYAPVDNLMSITFRNR